MSEGTPVDPTPSVPPDAAVEQKETESANFEAKVEASETASKEAIPPALISPKEAVDSKEVPKEAVDSEDVPREADVPKKPKKTTKPAEKVSEKPGSRGTEAPNRPKIPAAESKPEENELETVKEEKVSSSAPTKKLSQQAKEHAKRTFNCIGSYLQRRREHAEQLAKEQAELAKNLLAATLIMRSGESLTCADVPPIATRILREPSLLFVDLHSNVIGDEGARRLGEALKGNSTLKELHLWNNRITCDGARYLASGLMENTGLHLLDLDHNLIAQDGLAAFGDLLETTSSLETLCLSKNDVGRGVAGFAKQLLKNESLKKLDLRYCGISDVGAAAMGKCIKQNSTLIEVNLKGNNITIVGAHALMDAVQVNKTLARLKIFENKLTHEERTEFVKCMMKYLQPPPVVEEEETAGEILARGLMSGGSLALKGTLSAGMTAGLAGLKVGRAGLSVAGKGATMLKQGGSVIAKKASSVKVTPKRKTKKKIAASR
jgi:hypothetical protein